MKKKKNKINNKIIMNEPSSNKEIIEIKKENNKKIIFIYIIIVILIFLFIIFTYQKNCNIVNIIDFDKIESEILDNDNDIFIEKIYNHHNFPIICTNEIIVKDINNNIEYVNNQTLIINKKNTNTFNLSYYHSSNDSKINVIRNCKNYESNRYKEILEKIINLLNYS
jgi:hypothetical protein